MLRTLVPVTVMGLPTALGQGRRQAGPYCTLERSGQRGLVVKLSWPRPMGCAAATSELMQSRARPHVGQTSRWGMARDLMQGSSQRCSCAQSRARERMQAGPERACRAGPERSRGAGRAAGAIAHLVPMVVSTDGGARRHACLALAALAGHGAALAEAVVAADAFPRALTGLKFPGDERVRRAAATHVREVRPPADAQESGSPGHLFTMVALRTSLYLPSCNVCVAGKGRQRHGARSRTAASPCLWRVSGMTWRPAAIHMRRRNLPDRSLKA